MANLVDKSGDAYSNVVHGDGTNALAFTMPGNVALDVESVVATIDNTSGDSTKALLTVADSSGQVIARKRLGESLDGGTTGDMTWALRLADETAIALPYVFGSYSKASPFGTGAIPSGTPTNLNFNLRFVNSDPSVWFVHRDGNGIATGATDVTGSGLYLVYSIVAWAAAGFAKKTLVAQDEQDLGPIVDFDNTMNQSATLAHIANSTVLLRLAGFLAQLQVEQTSGVNQDVDTAALAVVKLA